jgi:hypothetical protein
VVEIKDRGFATELVEIEAVTFGFAQAASAEAEPHRPQSPRTSSAEGLAQSLKVLHGAHSRQRSVREPLNPAGDAAMGTLSSHTFLFLVECHSKFDRHECPINGQGRAERGPELSPHSYLGRARREFAPSLSDQISNQP